MPSYRDVLALGCARRARRAPIFRGGSVVRVHRVLRLWDAVLAVPILVLSGTVASPALADTWSPPPGAVDLLLFGSSTSSNLDSARELDPSPTQANGLTTVPALSIGHLPGRGTFALSSSPTAGQVYADPLGTCRS